MFSRSKLQGQNNTQQIHVHTYNLHLIVWIEASHPLSHTGKSHSPLHYFVVGGVREKTMSRMFQLRVKTFSRASLYLQMKLHFTNLWHFFNEMRIFKVSPGNTKFTGNIKSKQIPNTIIRLVCISKLLAWMPYFRYYIGRSFDVRSNQVHQKHPNFDRMVPKRLNVESETLKSIECCQIELTLIEPGTIDGSSTLFSDHF